MIIDVWMQHPTLRHMQDPIFESLRRWTGRQAPSEEIPVAASVAVFKEAGVSLGLCAAWSGPKGWLITNDEAAGFAAQSGGLFRPVAGADLSNPLEAVRELRRAVKDLGCVALRIVPWLWNLPPDDRRYYPLYAECCELDIPFCTQAGHTGPLCPSEPGRPIPYLDNVALDFPELKIIAGHVGFPWTNEMISLATKYENVYIDTSAYTAKRLPAELVAYMRAHGRNKVMFGTNYPMITPERCLADLNQLELSDEGREAYLGGTAARVFGV